MILKRWPLLLIVLWTMLTISIGSWWLYLVLKLSQRITLLGSPNDINYAKLVRWEGSFFIVLLLLATYTLFTFYLRELKRNKELNSFWASLTHELKTPLASMKLQAEVMNEMISQNITNDLTPYSERLIKDCKRLELEMDKILNLAKIEKNAQLNLTDLNLKKFVTSIYEKNFKHVHFQNNIPDDLNIIGDELAFKMIFTNLFDNSIRHTTQTPEVKISVKVEHDFCTVFYEDNNKFNGDIKKLGKLFYKHNSPKGSGIGLYIINKLMTQMNGKLDISNFEHLQFKLKIPVSKQSGDLHA